MQPNTQDKTMVEEKDTGKYCKPNCVSEKEILNLAWNYFQQHAQQRLSFFNFFVVFSVLMTTGLISTFQEKYDVHSIGIAVGMMLSLISYVFWKIDDRNKYLTKKGENAIKQIEKHYSCAKCYPGQPEFQIFTIEENRTDELKKMQLQKNIFSRQISHSKSFNLIFIIFFVVGVLGAGLSAYSQFFHQDSEQTILEKKKAIEIVELNRKVGDLINNNTMLNGIIVEMLKKQNDNPNNKPSTNNTVPNTTQPSLKN